MALHFSAATSQHTDPDLRQQARSGHGVPSQDPDPSAQIQLSAAEAAREVRSALTGGGMIAGAALGCLMGAIWAGGAGAVLGSVAGAYWVCWLHWLLACMLTVRAMLCFFTTENALYRFWSYAALKQ